MSSKGKERRCKLCGKLLLDEKLLFCGRCILEGRNKVGQVGSIVGGLVMTVFGTATFVSNSSNSNDQDYSDDQD